jgi:multiple sugar transport system permease protein
MTERSRGILSENEYKQPFYGVVYTIFMVAALLLSLVMIYPIFWVFSSTLKSSAEIYRVPATFFPSNPEWDNFIVAWKAFEYPRMVVNTMLVYLGTLTCRLIVVVPAAYALSRLAVPGRRFFYLMFLATLMLPAAAYLVPSYLVIMRLGLYDSWRALWFPAAAASMPLLLAKGFFDEIPRDLSEAARIDGATDLRILRSVILPNSKPIMAVISIFAFLEVWNNFFWQRLVFSSREKWTMPVMLWWRTSTIGGNPEMNVQLAGMFFSILPPFILFLIFQKYITEGITLTGLKG